ncbi:DUF4407 domain-containing protein [Carboxylicivirga sp. M1479]|uniref:DUF4407 domain-containing protein n=1 Tax=Carboxylicivirga sp. M1479 TaxID=2594476 RepID=UPI00117732C4|nr:DUF4407 domain-containing protein [Carboxylicivirga sp. M1479]TRX72064.1 DUF4407 domain-containing protein [Carboxylicivirga sp. M1479]
MSAFFKCIYHFILWSSGADLRLLHQVEIDKNKYVGIGGTVLFTALMAALAGGYAFYTTFQSIGIACVLGVFWGALIFNLDRYIISTMQFSESQKPLSRFLKVLPRLLMAIVLGLVIATPIELKLFEREIETSIEQKILMLSNQQQIHVDSLKSVQLLGVSRQKEDLNEQINQRIAKHDLLQDKAERAYALYLQELDGSGGSGQRGSGPIFREKKQEYERLLKQATAYAKDSEALNKVDRERIKQLELKVEETQKAYQRRLQALIDKNEDNNGLAARLLALSEIGHSNKSMLMAKWLISLLFIIIETAPVLFKLISNKSAYDYRFMRLQNEAVSYEKFLHHQFVTENEHEKIIFDDWMKQRLTLEKESNTDLAKQKAKLIKNRRQAALEQGNQISENNAKRNDIQNDEQKN